jgi:hypothetical protein
MCELSIRRLVPSLIGLKGGHYMVPLWSGRFGMLHLLSSFLGSNNRYYDRLAVSFALLNVSRSLIVSSCGSARRTL